MDINAEDSRWRWFRPCLLHSICQCTAPRNLRVSKEDYRKQIRKLRLVMEGKKERLLAEMTKEWLSHAPSWPSWRTISNPMVQ